ncbi:MAG: hypothetical protein L0210_05395 [Rhodospirillales bacterium]|nr:hypothetical protein [Rhodospirillales bacterium]
MARRRKRAFADLSKGELRKLNALRKSLGEDIGGRAFAEWLSVRGTGPAESADNNAHTIAEALQPLIETGDLHVPRGGYLLRRGRGRVIVERTE